jgi:hypothetical protein
MAPGTVPRQSVTGISSSWKHRADRPQVARRQGHHRGERVGERGAAHRDPVGPHAEVRRVPGQPAQRRLGLLDLDRVLVLRGEVVVDRGHPRSHGIGVRSHRSALTARLAVPVSEE